MNLKAIFTTERERNIFFTGLLIKVILANFLSSYFFSDFFIPFIKNFLSHPFQKTYAFTVGGAESAEPFPYPAVMLYALSVPMAVFSTLLPAKAMTFLTFLIMRIPLFIADVGILMILRSWLRPKFHLKLLYFYWLSPVLIYISYVHGQLDVIPIFFVFFSLATLFKGRYFWSAVLLGLAVASKTHVFISVPFFVLFLISDKKNAKEIISFIAIVFLAFVLPNIPFLLDQDFIKSVFNNKEQGKAFVSAITLGGASLYLIPISLILLFIRGGLLRTFTRDLFVMFLAFCFTVVLLFISPMQGWYFWIIPFFTFFYARIEGRAQILFWSLQVAYLIYFLVSKDSDFLSVFLKSEHGVSQLGYVYNWVDEEGFDSDKLVGLAFSLLQTLLFVNGLWIYIKGIEKYKKLKILSSPLMVGIGGDSGAGKTYLTTALQNVFSHKRVTRIAGDDTHKWERGHQKWQDYTHLNPKANRLHQEIKALHKLRQGRHIFRRNYDHSNGEFTEKLKVESNNLVIYEGLHPFYIHAQRKIFDLKIFIRPDEVLSKHWKIIRDSKKRGYSKIQVLESIEKRFEDFKEYIAEQRQHADILVEPLLAEPLKNLGDAAEDVTLFYRISLGNSASLDPALDVLSQYPGLEVRHEFCKDDMQVIELKGSFEGLDGEAFEKLFPSLKLLGTYEPDFSKDIFGALVVLLTYAFFEKAGAQNV